MIIRMLLGVAFIIGFSSIVMAVQEEVTVTLDGERESYRLKKAVKQKAREEAIKKFIGSFYGKRKVPSEKVKDVVSRSNMFVKNAKEISSKWKWLTSGKTMGQLTCKFIVKLKDDEIRKFIGPVDGLTDSFEIVILEEKPTQAQMEMFKAFGTKLDQSNFFVQNYTKYQRGLRDTILKNMSDFGHDVKLLADRSEFKKYKTKDNNLVGVFFDVKTNTFANEEDFIQTVKDNFPDTFVLYYRFDSIMFDKNTKQCKVRIGLNLKDLSNGTTKAIQTEPYSITVSSNNKAFIIDAIGQAAEMAAQQSLNKAKNKINDSLQRMLKERSKLKALGPLGIYINMTNIEAKHRKKMMYYLRKDLVKNKITTKSKARIRGNVLTVKTDKVLDPEEFFFETLTPILEERGLEVDDTKLVIDGSTLKIKPTAKGDDE